MLRPIFFWIILLCCLAVISSFAQTPPRDCGADDHMQMLLQQYPDMQKNQRAIEDFTQQKIASHNGNSRSALITIPTVVHVVYRTNSQNISNAQVISQIDVLNQDFRRSNSDALNTSSQYVGVAADVDIEFCLATVDPNGNSTSGITRTSTSVSSFSYNNDGIKFNSLGGKNAWPTGQYLNIWVGNLSGNLLGYAQFPGGPASTDGIVILYRACGTVGNVQYPYHLGRTATHEVGHWLNLRHIWGDGGCSVDDFVNDTPLSDDPNFGCALGHISCGTIDMVENYMDYSDDACVNLFTHGQSARMNAMLAVGGFRESLLYSDGCGAGTTPPPAICAVPAGLFASAITTTQATLYWNPVVGASFYNVRARRIGASSWSTGSTSATGINFTNLSDCTNYEFQIQAVCGGSSSGFSASSNFTSDGCPPAPCVAPSGIVASFLTLNLDALLRWNAVTSAVSYDLRIRRAGTSIWSNGNTTDTSSSYVGLLSCTDYEFQVKTICDASSSGYSATETFTTPGCGSPPPQSSCDAPTGLFESNVSSKSVTVTWSAISNASYYKIRYREVGEKWRNKFVRRSTSSKLNGFKKNRTYEWQVQAICGSTESAFSILESFVGGVGRFANDDATEFMIYPNPASNIVTIQLPGEELYTIRLYDLSGKLLNQIQVDGYDFGTQDISVTDLPAGIYYIQLEGESVGSTKKLVVTH